MTIKLAPPAHWTPTEALGHPAPVHLFSHWSKWDLLLSVFNGIYCSVHLMASCSQAGQRSWLNILSRSYRVWGKGALGLKKYIKEWLENYREGKFYGKQSTSSMGPGWKVGGKATGLEDEGGQCFSGHRKDRLTKKEKAWAAEERNASLETQSAAPHCTKTLELTSKQSWSK